ncbi:MAG TPA: hypothetical protein VJ796_08105 [Acidimicrobiia bacterium]|nr:hypothetical protein [Acidimicrobiia bacterium]
MTQNYMVINKHQPEDCEPMDAGISRVGEHLKGKDFYCTCPFGEHGFYMILEGTSSEEVIEGLPVEWRKGTRALALEVFRIPR